MSSRDDARFTPAAWTAYGISLVSALVSLGFSTAALGLIAKSDPTYTYVLFNLARTLALVLGFVLVARARSFPALVLMVSLMAVVQLLDGVVGAIDSDPMKTYGPWAIAVISFVALSRLVRSRPRTEAPAAAKS
ncbi:hypothetical protein [Streptomyces sp. NPDC047046]|uniref:hypothetical protein n=1 Tax=Streptomyces sp. NPDC047046 TaxID=3155378 RepID=UPI0033C67255